MDENIVDYEHIEIWYADKDKKSVHRIRRWYVLGGVEVSNRKEAIVYIRAITGIKSVGAATVHIDTLPVQVTETVLLKGE